VRNWGLNVAKSVLGKTSGKDSAWTFHPIAGSHDTRNPWAVQERKSADGDKDSTFLSSNAVNELLTGVVRSPAFTIPPKLSFYMAGHNGPVGKPAIVKNYVRLCDAKTGEVLAEQVPPRNDTAQLISWDLSKWAGREGYFEATDGYSATGWAWLAFGRFQPAVVRISDATMHLSKTMRIVQDLRLTDLAGAVEAVLTDRDMDQDSRVAAAQALAKLGAAQHAATLAAVVSDQAAPEEVRHAAADALGPVGSPESFATLAGAMATAPEKLQLALAKALASTPAGAEALLDAVQSGKASARLLQDPTLRERLTIAKPANLDTRLAALTKGLPAADSAIQKLIDERAAAFDPNKASKVKGRQVFEKNCMVCHMVGGKGAHVGPQLDGIGIRGVARLAEDVLDPSRNVDAAFRYHTFVMDDGNLVDGIVRHEEGQTLTIADATGKEVTIDKSKIKRRIESKLSLMPSNFGEIIPEKDFDDLMSFLLSTAQK
jgi:putative heme-binding domain-containing protein